MNIADLIELLEHYRPRAHGFSEYQDSRYPYAGLVAEVGELYDVRAKLWRGDWAGNAWKAHELYQKELGDVAWMLNEIACTADFGQGYTWAELLEPTHAALVSADTLRAMMDASLVVERSYAAPRGELRFALRNAVLCYLAILSELGHDIALVLDANLSKLSKRAAAGTIKGSGHGHERQANVQARPEYATDEELLQAVDGLSVEALDYLEVVFMHALDCKEAELAELRQAGFVDQAGLPYITADGKAASRMIFG